MAIYALEFKPWSNHYLFTQRRIIISWTINIYLYIALEGKISYRDKASFKKSSQAPTIIFPDQVGPIFLHTVNRKRLFSFANYAQSTRLCAFRRVYMAKALNNCESRRLQKAPAIKAAAPADTRNAAARTPAKKLFNYPVIVESRMCTCVCILDVHIQTQYADTRPALHAPNSSAAASEKEWEPWLLGIKYL